jgi:integral membrane protein
MNHMQKVENPEFLKRLRTLSLIEGCSTLVLFFIAMPLKYSLDLPEAVTWPGRIHGGLFVLLVMYAVLAIRSVPISIKLSFMLIIAAIIPFGPFLMDKKLRALGRDKHFLRNVG